MIWGAFCGTTSSQLALISREANVDSALVVKNILYSYLIPFWHTCCEQYGWITVVENGAPGNKGVSIHYRNFNQIKTIKQSAQSSDLNLVENLELDIENKLQETQGRIEEKQKLVSQI